MTYLQQILKSAILFSPTDYDQLEHFARNQEVWRITTFKTRQGHLAHYSSSEEVV